MYLKEHLINLKQKLMKNQNVELQKQNNETNYVFKINDTELTNILNDAINNFFPTTGQWNSSCFNKNNQSLQSNLRNNELLSMMILRKANLPNEYYDKVLNFINSSTLFKHKVYEYEQAIIKWQINFMNDGGENWICDKELGGDFCLLFPNCDIAFRKGVVDTLSAIGIDKEAIEEGIEKNANMWRDYYIQRAFQIKYEPLMINFLGNEKIEPLPKANLEHKKAWIRMRKYDYYCNHKKSVDLYGVIEPEMLLTQEELIKLKSYLDVENKKRLQFIEQHNNKNIKQKKLTLSK